MKNNPIFAIIIVRSVQVSVLAVLAHLILRLPLTGPHAIGLFLTPVLCVDLVFVFVGQWSWGLPILTRLPGRRRVAALTFDDGPSAYVTPRILDTLRNYNARATFFVLGSAARSHPELLKRIAAEGHEIGLHGDRHHPMVLAGWGTIQQEIVAARASIAAACPNKNMLWLRPPYGFKTVALTLLARRSGLRLAAWSVNSKDYRAGLPRHIAERVLTRMRPGAIILLHDGNENARTADALPLILEGLRDQGYDCATLPEAFER